MDSPDDARLEAEFEAAELFEVASVFRLPVFAEECGEVFLLAELGDVGGERFDLQVDLGGDVDIEVRVIRVPEQDFADLVRLEALGEVLGEVEMVACGRVDGVERCGAGGAVVRVVDEAIADDDVGRVVGEDGVGADACGCGGRPVRAGRGS